MIFRKVEHHKLIAHIIQRQFLCIYTVFVNSHTVYGSFSLPNLTYSPIGATKKDAPNFDASLL